MIGSLALLNVLIAGLASVPPGTTIVHSGFEDKILRGEPVRLDIVIENTGEESIVVREFRASASFCGIVSETRRPATDPEGLLTLPGLIEGFVSEPVKQGGWVVLPVTIVPPWTQCEGSEGLVDLRIVFSVVRGTRGPEPVVLQGQSLVTSPMTELDIGLYADYVNAINQLTDGTAVTMTVFSILKRQVEEASARSIEQGLFSGLSDNGQSVALAEHIDTLFTGSDYYQRYSRITRCRLSGPEIAMLNQVGEADQTRFKRLDYSGLPRFSRLQQEYLERVCGGGLRIALQTQRQCFGGLGDEGIAASKSGGLTSVVPTDDFERFILEQLERNSSP